MSDLNFLREYLQEQQLACSGLGYSNEFLSVKLPEKGVVQISGNARYQWVIYFLAEHSELICSWLTPAWQLNPVAFWQKSIHFSRILFLEAADQLFEALIFVVRSQKFPVVVVECQQFSLVQLRKLQLLAKRSRVLLLWLTTKYLWKWPLAGQMQIEFLEQVDRIQVVAQKWR